MLRPQVGLGESGITKLVEEYEESVCSVFQSFIARYGSLNKTSGRDNACS